jgi:hypothetical protein
VELSAPCFQVTELRHLEAYKNVPIKTYKLWTTNSVYFTKQIHKVNCI